MEPHSHPTNPRAAPSVVAPSPEANDAQSQADRVAAEILIRTTVQTIANGANVHDLNGLIQRNVGRISTADIRAGRLGSLVVGDIVSSVEQAKGNANFNWSAATPQQISAYLASKGIQLAGYNDRAASADRSNSSSGGSASKGGDADTRGVTSANYSSSAFAGTGLSYGNFEAMRKEGFNATQINAAVSTNRELGLGPNDNPAATARLQRDIPWAVPGLHQTHHNWQDVKGFEDRAKQADARGDKEGAARIRKQAEEARKRAEEHDRKEHDRVRKEAPHRAHDHLDRQRRIRDSVMHHAASLTPGNEEQTKANLAAIEKYRANPNDAAARKNYETLKQAANRDPNKRRAMAKIDREVTRNFAIKSLEVKKNEVKQQTGDNDLAFLNEPSTATAPVLGPNAMVTSPNSAPPAANETPKPATPAVVEASNAPDSTKPSVSTPAATPTVKSPDSAPPPKQADASAANQEKKKVVQAKPPTPVA